MELRGICAYVCVYVSLRVRVCICVRARARVRMRVCEGVCVYVYTTVYMCMQYPTIESNFDCCLVLADRYNLNRPTGNR